MNLNFDFDIARLGDSQSLTPFGSQGYGSSQPIGGLVFPSSSPHAPAEFRLPGDDGLDNRQDNFHEPGFIPGGDDGLDLSEPGFTFGEDGDLIDLPVRSSVARTPGAPPGSVMRTDAGASTQVRQDHGEGQEANTQVSLTCNLLPMCFQSFGRVSLLVLLLSFTSRSVTSLHILSCTQFWDLQSSILILTPLISFLPSENSHHIYLQNGY